MSYAYEYGYQCNNGGHRIPATAETIAHITGESYSRVAGLIGPDSVGDIHVVHDYDYTWDDVDPEPYLEAVIPTGISSEAYSISVVSDPAHDGINQFLDGYERIVNTYGYPRDGHYSDRVLRSYATVLGLKYSLKYFSGTVPSEYLEVVHVSDGDRSSTLEELRTYWNETASGVDMKLTTATGVELFEESEYGLVGDDATDECIQGHLLAFLRFASDANIAAKRGNNENES